MQARSVPDGTNSTEFRKSIYLDGRSKSVTVVCRIYGGTQV
jgi:hypothetical protein